MKKTTKGEGKLQVLRGDEAQVLNDHFAKTGKYAVSEFSSEEKDELESALDAAKNDATPEVRRDGVKIEEDSE